MWTEDKCWENKDLISFNDIRCLNLLKQLSTAVNENLLHITCSHTLYAISCIYYKEAILFQGFFFFFKQS